MTVHSLNFRYLTNGDILYTDKDHRPVAVAQYAGQSRFTLDFDDWFAAKGGVEDDVVRAYRTLGGKGHTLAACEYIALAFANEARR